MGKKNRHKTREKTNNPPIKNLKISKYFFSFSDIFKKKEELIILGFLIILPIILFWQTTNFSFVWDDNRIHLAANPLLQTISFENIKNIWAETKGMYMPVTYTFWALLKPIGESISGMQGFNPFIYHLINLIFHLFNGILVYIILRNFVKDKWAVFGGAILFLLHPIQVEAVAWISELRGLLSMFFGLISVYLYIKSINIKIGNFGVQIFSFIFYTLAILSKPSMVVLPIFAFIFSIYFYQEKISVIIKRLLSWILITIFPVVMIMLPDREIIGKVINSPLWSRPFIWMDAINFYFSKIIFPLNLSPSYHRIPQIVLGKWQTYFLWIIPVIIASILWKIKKKHSLLGISFLLFIIGFLPVSGLILFVFQDYSTVADRYLYLSMFGVSLAFSYLFSFFKGRKSQIIMSLILTVFFLQSCFIQTPIWKSPESLWTHCINVTPDEAKAYYMLGNIRKDAGKFEEAVTFFSKAIEMDSSYGEAYINRGSVLSAMNKDLEAIKDLNEAVKYSPHNPKLYNNRGIILTKIRQFDKAIADYNMSLKLNNNNVEILQNRAFTYGEMKNYDSAIKDYNLIEKLAPNFPELKLKRGKIYLQKNDINKAIKDFNDYIEKDPKNATAYFHIARAYKKINMINKSLEYYAKAIKLNSNYADALFNRGNIYNSLNQYPAAIKDYENAIKIRPDFTDVYINLGIIYSRLKKYDQEIECYSTALKQRENYIPALRNRSFAYYSSGKFLKAYEDIKTIEKHGGNVNSDFKKQLMRKLGN